VGPDEKPGWTRVVVEDSGVGIPAEHLPQIFDRFFRVRDAQTNRMQGLGLGLSFVSWIVSAHGGTIEVESKVGEGSRFTVRLPMGSSGVPSPATEPAAVSL
jgi:signal transduction histidine kinase